MLARALGETGGRLVAVEADAARVADTRRNLEAAGLDGCVELVHGDASREIERLDGPFDLILQDAAKALYPSMLDACVERLRQRGILAADDGLFRPMGQREEMAGPIHAYNERVFADPRLRSTILPIGDGLTLSVRIR
jgi:predicted O-methyltransferase YrrM